MAQNGKLDLVGTYEAHLILGVERSRIARWLSENEQGKAKIPPPADRVKSGPIWRRAQIEAKLRELAADAGVATEGKTFDEWAARRSWTRAQQLDPPLSAEELEGIIRRPVAASVSGR